MQEKLRTIFVIVLPAAVPGILSGVILAIGRIVGESAALILRQVQWRQCLGARASFSYLQQELWQFICTAYCQKDSTQIRLMQQR